MQRIRLLTWNLHGCVDRRGRFRPEEVAAVIEAIDADVVSLQEVDSRRERVGDIDVPGLLTRSAGPHAVFAATINTDTGRYGHMLASRHPIELDGIHELPQIGDEPRKAIRARVFTAVGELDVVSTHLGFRRREQAAQIRALADVAGVPATPTVLMGDLNERRGRGASFRSLRANFQSIPRHATFPSSLPILPLDQIWFSGLTLAGSRVHRNARGLSDHLPLIAELAFTD